MFTTRLFAIALAVCMTIALVHADLPSDIKCQICEDVVQTYHDRWRCAGESMSDGPVNMCTGPVFSCESAPDLDECESMRTTFTKELSADIWVAARKVSSAFDICVELTKCSNNSASKECKEALKDPECDLKAECKATQVCSSTCYICNRLINEWPIFQETCKPPGANLNDEVEIPNEAPIVPQTSDPISFVTQQEMQSNYLNYDDEQFLRMAAHGRASFNNPENAERVKRIQDAMENGLLSQKQLHMIAEAAATVEMVGHDSVATSFIELGVEAKKYVDANELDSDMHNDFSAAEADSQVEFNPRNKKRRSKRPPVKRFRGGFDLMEIQERCMNTWEELKESRRARYFMTYKRTTMPELDPNDLASGLAWDAHSVCKCLKMCPMQPGESLQYLNICRYNKMQDILMRTAFPSLPKA